MIFRSLGFRLSVLVGIALLLGLAGLFYFTMTHHEAALLRLKREEANLLSDTIKGSLSYAMLQGKEGRDAIHRIIEEISAREEIERVRIFNAVGLIQYSSDPSEMGRTVNKEAENCKQCHSGATPLPPEAIRDRSRFFYTPSDSGESRYRVLGVINPIRNEKPACRACHGDQTVLGVLDVVVSLRKMDRDILLHRRDLLIFGLVGVVAIITAVALLIHFLVHRPVAALVDGTRKVGEMELDYRIPTDRRDELGNLAEAFNTMTGRLHRAREKIQDFASNLKEQVEAKTAELQSAQVQMLRSEKMAAIGQMAAGVAHEINNPLTGVVTFAHLLRKKTPPGTQEHQDLETIIEEAKRCSKIARGLLDFARGGELVREATDVCRIVDQTLALVEQQALFHNIEVVREFAADLPPVLLDRDRVRQVFLNLIVNAAEATGGRGLLTLGVDLLRGADEDGDCIRVSIWDTGRGVPPEDLGRIFDPFFTTKEAGEGTGLGLSISHRIIEDHGGRILVTSWPGEGTEFRVLLPLSRDEGKP